jgi:hypothetical protein
MRLFSVTAALAVVLLAAACSSDKPAAPAAAVTTKASAAPKAADTYDGAQRLVGALNAAGVPCLNWERTEDPTGALERGSCYVGTEEIVASIYASHEDVEADQMSKVQLLAGVSDFNEVAGGNWTLSCDSAAMCSTITHQFGGRLIHVPAE